MAKGGYIGGSTVIRVHPTASGKRRTRGLLALEVEYEKTGEVRPQTLLPQKPRKKVTKGRKTLETKAGGRTKPDSAAMKPATAARAPAVRVPPAESVTGRYSAEEVRKYAAERHPRCTGTALKRVVKLGAQGRWTGMQLGDVVASCMEQHLLYEVFGLPKLVSCGFTQERALRMVSPMVREVLAEWGARPVWAK